MSQIRDFFDEMALSYDTELPELGWDPVRLVEGWPFLPSPGARVLDLGCGTGAVLQRFAAPKLGAASLTGLDLSPVMVAQARARGALLGADLRVGTVTALPFETGQFDHVCCLAMLEFVADLAPVFAALSRVMAPGGQALISVEDAWDLRGKPMPRLEHRYNLFPLYRRSLEAVDAALPPTLTRVESRRIAAYTEPESGHTAAYLMCRLSRGREES